jgi:hypothetical protein
MSSIEIKIVRFCEKREGAILLLPFILYFPYGIKVIPGSFFCQGGEGLKPLLRGTPSRKK